jgi:hypothetical protein
MEIEAPERMELSEIEHVALKNFISSKQCGNREQQQEEIAEFMAIRHKAASEFKQKIFFQGLSAACIDVNDLQRRQERDQDTVNVFLSRQKQLIVLHAAEINQRNEFALNERLNRWDQINTRDWMSPPQQPVVLTLNTAAEILQSGPGTSSIAANNNLAFTQAKVSSGGYLGGPLKGDIVNVDWLFVWTPPRDGLLDATSFLLLNGSSFLATNSTCDGGSASADISATMTLSQGNMKDSSTTRIFDARVSSAWGDSLGAVNIMHVDETDTVGYKPTQFPVLANIPIIITVTASLYALVNNGQAELDFMSGGFRLNVPYVFLQLI